jgi:Aspartyl protease
MAAGSGEDVRVRSYLGSLLLGWLCLFGATTLHAECVVTERATVPLTVTDGTITVPVEVNGITASFILDTGAQRSVVTEAAVQRLGLARDQWVGTTMSGIGGVNNRANADPRSLSLAGIPLVRRTLNHDTSLTVATLARSGPLIDGLLGRDYLSMFDLDLTVSAGRLTLYQPRGCTGRFLPWTGNYAAIPVSNPTEDALVVPVVLDGIKLRAMLDSGASASVLAAPGIFRMGLNLASLSSDAAAAVSGLGAHTVTMRRHRFQTLRVGGQTIDAPDIWVAPVRMAPIVDMILGADWLSTRRVWISYATRQIFVAEP